MRFSRWEESKKEIEERQDGKMKKQTAIFLAEGFEEIEALTVVDLLRRAQIEITMVSISDNMSVKGAHGIVVQADALFDQVNFDEMDALVLPGGMPGTRNLQAYEPLIKAIKKAASDGKIVSAICAAPLILGLNHLLEGKKASCYPGFEEDLLEAKVSYDTVSKDGNIITSRGMGTAIEFACELIGVLLDEETAKKMKETIIYQA